jgi:conjugative transfer signal peptidase TraF
MLFISLAFGLFGTAMMTIGLSQKTRMFRALGGLAFLAVVAIGWDEIAATGLRVNFTPSMPMGLYRLTSIPTTGISRGMLVAACPPPDAAELGRLRGYLAVGPCPGDVEPLLKTVVAVEGDIVAVSSRGVAVNNCFLHNSGRLSADRMGRPLRPWSSIAYALRRGEIWLYADNVRSWDSRYWGPISTTHVVSQVLTVLVFWTRSTSAVAKCLAITRVDSAQSRSCHS